MKAYHIVLKCEDHFLYHSSEVVEVDLSVRNHVKVISDLDTLNDRIDNFIDYKDLNGCEYSIYINFEDNEKMAEYAWEKFVRLAWREKGIRKDSVIDHLNHSDFGKTP